MTTKRFTTFITTDSVQTLDLLVDPKIHRTSNFDGFCVKLDGKQYAYGSYKIFKTQYRFVSKRGEDKKEVFAKYGKEVHENVNKFDFFADDSSPENFFECRELSNVRYSYSRFYKIDLFDRLEKSSDSDYFEITDEGKLVPQLKKEQHKKIRWIDKYTANILSIKMDCNEYKLAPELCHMTHYNSFLINEMYDNCILIYTHYKIIDPVLKTANGCNECYKIELTHGRSPKEGDDCVNLQPYGRGLYGGKYVINKHGDLVRE